MSKVHARCHEYPHVEKIKNLPEQNFKGEANKISNWIVRILNEATLVVNIYKLNSVVKYRNSLIFVLVESNHIAT